MCRDEYKICCLCEDEMTNTINCAAYYTLTYSSDVGHASNHTDVITYLVSYHVECMNAMANVTTDTKELSNMYSVEVLNRIKNKHPDDAANVNVMMSRDKCLILDPMMLSNYIAYGGLYLVPIEWVTTFHRTG